MVLNECLLLVFPRLLVWRLFLSVFVLLQMLWSDKQEDDDEEEEEEVSGHGSGKGVHVIVLHHGYCGSSMDMRLIKNYIRRASVFR